MRNERLDLRAVWLLIFVCLLWGLQQVAIKVALENGLPPALQAGLRSALSACCLAGWTTARSGPSALRRMFKPDAMLALGLVMGTVFSIEFLLLYFGMVRTTASRGVLFLYTSPFFVALGAHLLIPAERITARQAVGLLCAFAGVVVAVLDGLRVQGGTLLGDTMITGTAILWAGMTLSIRAVPLIGRQSASRILMLQLSFSSVIMLIYAACSGELPALRQASGLAYATLIYQSGIVAFASYLVWYWLMTIYPANKVSAFTFLTPIFGLLAGALCLGEPVSPGLVFALVCVAGGLFLVNGRGKAKVARVAVS
jgi:drug/metabolite transporter (DMT)-like permease